VLQEHCARGRVAEVAEVVSTALLSAALQDNSIPQPRGLRTAALAEQALQACKVAAEAYARHGVLCAKGYYPAGQLMLLMFQKWEQEFTAVVQHPEENGGLMDAADPDFLARSAMSAQLLLRLLSKLQVGPGGEHLLLPIRDLEGICVAATKKMYAAFTSPDAALHQLLHGKEQDGEDRRDDVG